MTNTLFGARPWVLASLVGLRQVASAKKLTIAALVLSPLQSACNIICIDCGEGKAGGSQTPNDPKFYVFDYRVSDGVSAATYAAGCGVANSADELSNAVVAEVPLGVEYVLDVTAIRFVRSNTTAQIDSGNYCESPFEEIPMKHVNPACYAIVSDSHELISASVIEPNGNALSSQTAFWIDGSSNDVQRFRFRSHTYGKVEVSYNSPPCYGTSNSRALLTVRSP